MVCQEELLIQKVCNLYDQISNLENLKPSKHVDKLFTELVLTCIPPSPIDINTLSIKVQEIRSKLIRLCGEAEGYLEVHFSTLLSSLENPLQNLSLFPYYSNYLKLGQLEFTILRQHSPVVPNKIAFVGSGPLPLTSIVLATKHLTAATFHNFDIDPLANSLAIRLVSSDSDLSNRMFFHTTNIMDVGDELKEFDVIFLAALVGMDKVEKVRIIGHLAKFMAPGAVLLLRSANGARAFLYPVVDPCDLSGFEVLSVFHPTDEVINSVVIACKHQANDQQGGGGCGGVVPNMILPSCKCSEIHAFNHLNHPNMVEELTIEDQHV